LLGVHESGEVHASLHNPTSQGLNYSIYVRSIDNNFQPHTLRISGKTARQAALPAGDTIGFDWSVKASEPGKQAIIISAVSSQDAASPEVFHTWQSSYIDSCGIAIIDILGMNRKELIRSNIILSASLILAGVILVCARFWIPKENEI
jgi:hypothetical protein